MSKRILAMKIEELSVGLDTHAKVIFSSLPVEQIIGGTFIPYPVGDERTPEIAQIEEELRDKLKKICAEAQKTLHLGGYYIFLMSKSEIEEFVKEQMRITLRNLNKPKEIT